MKTLKDWSSYWSLAEHFIWEENNYHASLYSQERDKQAGAELCQAQVKLGLAKLAVNRNKLRAYLLQVWGHIPFKKKLIWSFICLNIEVVFHLPK